MADAKMNWTNTKIKLGELKPWADNPRQSTKAQARKILKSFERFGQVQPVSIGPDNSVYDGHQRLSALLTVHGADYQIDARQSDRPLTDDERRKLVITLHAGAVGSWDWDKLSSWEPAQMMGDGFDADLLKDWKRDVSALDNFLKSEKPEPVDAEPQIDRAEELRQKWQVETGQMWQLGEHRIICGDCTDAAVVERVMMGERAELVCADPPYGMGKENEGVANDNLYNDKLDDFQIAWWGACRRFVLDNGSAYIWGTAEDLWRLWYRKLKNSERLTFRNEIVWNKGDAGAGGISHQGAEGLRIYPQATERCLFFMLGEQGFNNNADNYWEKWDKVRLYLKFEAEKVGLTPLKLKEICGVGMYSHWFTKSQWTLITEEHYLKLQNAFKCDYKAFERDYDELKRDYDELKRDFYNTRAYFDNTHELMIDVWDYERVIGDERHNHATPKPIKMMERIIKTSAREDDIVYEPFSGSGTTLIACENLNRKCRAVEISPAYVAVALERWSVATGKTPVLMDDNG